MIKVEKLTDLKEIFVRTAADYTAADIAVAPIIADVRARGDAAVLDYTEKFDGVRPDTLLVPDGEFDAAFSALSPEFLAVLRRAEKNIAEFHEKQLPQGFSFKRGEALLGQRYTPVARAGVYVPGGTAAYPSSVLMNILPARIAGVPDIAVATPPGKDGSIPPAILAAAKLAGASRVYKMGGAQAIAALAYGTETVTPVDKLTGPGNIYVAAAKRAVSGNVGIDMIAGPSEILVIADENAKPSCVAADMLSQLEHDRLSTAVLITCSKVLGEAVASEIERRLPLLPRADICRVSAERGGRIFVTETLEAAIEAANAIAPEHLELCTADPMALLPLVKNAGSIFLGYDAPEALGDYFAGPNHILPTGGSARFSSPLGVEDFMKRSSYIYYTRDELAGVRADVELFAQKEGLYAHAQSVASRFEEEL